MSVTLPPAADLQRVHRDAQPVMIHAKEAEAMDGEGCVEGGGDGELYEWATTYLVDEV